MNTEITSLSLERGTDTRERFRSFADSAPLPMWLFDPELNGIAFNRAWARFTGHSSSDLPGDKWVNEIHAQDRDPFLKAFRKSSTAQDSFSVECRLQSYAGEFHYFLITGTPQFGELGQLQGYVAAALDLTDRKAMQDALRLSEMRCRAVFGPSIGNVAVIDCAGRIIGLNDGWLQFARQHGGKLRDVGAGSSYLDVCQRAMKAGNPEAGLAHRGIVEVLDGSIPEFTFEYSCPTRTEELWFEMIVHPLRRQEGGAIITHLNITNRRRAELQAQSLLHELAHVSRVAVLGELTASFAHELSQPLTAIHSNAQIAKRLLSENSQGRGELEEILGDILADNVRAGKILHQLRALLKKDRVRLKPLKLNNLIRDVADLLGDEAVLKKVKVSLHLDPSLPCVQGERVQLQQVILNLMMNGFEAMRHIDTKHRELSIETGMHGKEHVLILVRDSGPGIPAQQIDRIFEPFFTTKPEGLGMGLAICRSIVEVHGGNISVANNPEKGVSFRVVLPVPGRENL